VVMKDLKAPLIPLNESFSAKAVVTSPEESFSETNKLFPTPLVPRRLQYFREELEDLYGPSFLTRYNNQSSILMCSVTCQDLTNVRPKEDMIMLMHDTRVYYFKVDESRWIDLDGTIQELTNMFLILLTTDKYRLLYAFFSFFQSVDKVVSLMLLILLMFGDSVEDWSEFFQTYWTIWFVWIVEMYYNSMEYNVKLWILTRVSLYFGIAILVMYYLAFSYCDLFDYEENPMVVFMYFIRLGAFFIEMGVEFCIDKELAFDISQGSVKPFRNMPFARSPDKGLQATILPDGVRFQGTICAWTVRNVFREKHFPRPDLYHRHFLSFLILLNALPTFVVFLITHVFLILSSVFCYNYDSTILEEAWKEQSF